LRELKDFRKRVGFSLHHCAAYFGVFYTTFCRWQSGKTRPSKAAMRKIDAAIELAKTNEGRAELEDWKTTFDDEKARLQRNARP